MYLISREEFGQLKSAWATRSEHTAAEHIIYNLLRSKLAKHGFVEKTKNIQGNDPWYAYSLAKRTAWSFCKNYQSSFKARFGIEMPESLVELIRNA